MISKGLIIFIVILVVLIAAIIGLYFLGKRAQKKQAEQKEMIQASKQSVNMLIIDKKRMKIKDSGLPQAVIDQTPKLMRGTKLPIVKAKIGPQIMTLVCDDQIFDKVPLKREVKASISGIYIVDVKGLHNVKQTKEPEKEKNFFQKVWAEAKKKAAVDPVK